MLKHLIISFLAAGSPPQEPHEVKPDPAAAAEETPIVVTATKLQTDENEPAVRLGSRLPQKPLKLNNIASSTGVAGLTPGSGVEPLSSSSRWAKRRLSKCVSSSASIGKEATCLLIQAETAFQRGDAATGIDIYRFLNGSDEFSPEERLAAAEKLFAFGQTSSDPFIREEALLRMLKTDAIPQNKAQSARRSLVTFALKRDDVDLAISRLREAVAAEPADGQSLANLAILLRQQGAPDAADHMLRAIAAKKAEGQEIPPGWAEFLEQ